MSVPSFLRDAYRFASQTRINRRDSEEKNKARLRDHQNADEWSSSGSLLRRSRPDADDSHFCLRFPMRSSFTFAPLAVILRHHEAQHPWTPRRRVTVADFVTVRHFRPGDNQVGFPSYRATTAEPR